MAAMALLATLQWCKGPSTSREGLAFMQTLPGAHRVAARPRVLAALRPARAFVAPEPAASAAKNRAVMPLCAALVAVAAAARRRALVARQSKGKPQSSSGVRVRKPKNNALRNCSIATFEELTTRKRYEPLVYMFRRRFARPKGKPIKTPAKVVRESGHKYTSSWHKGYHGRKYRIIDFGRTKRGIFGEITTIEYDPYRNCRICLVKYEDGEMRYILHAMGFFVGQQVIAAEDAAVFVGNAMPLDNVPIGTQIHNIAMHPWTPGRIARAAGASAMVLSREGKYVTVKMPSTEVRLLHKNCWCTIGKVARTEAQLIKLGKAGKSRHLGWTPHVRGTAKNAWAHPHGGGEGRSPIGHKHQKNPFGQAALGRRTRKQNIKSTRYILIRRKKKSGRPG